MLKSLIIYDSKTGNTRRMAELIAESVGNSGMKAVIRHISEASIDDLPEYNAIVIGSPTYYGGMTAEIKKFLDDSVKYHGKLDGKAGGAFSSSRQVGGGNETTINGILNALMIHGMIVQGDWQGDHYGPVAINAPDKRTESYCARFGQRISELTKKIFPEE